MYVRAESVQNLAFFFSFLFSLFRECMYKKIVLSLWVHFYRPIAANRGFSVHLVHLSVRSSLPTFFFYFSLFVVCSWFLCFFFLFFFSPFIFFTRASCRSTMDSDWIWVRSFFNYVWYIIYVLYIIDIMYREEKEKLEEGTHVRGHGE